MYKSNNVVKKLILGILFSSLNFMYAQNIPDWENPDVNGINKEKPHAYSFLASDKANNPTIQSLNGIWKFKWSADPQSRPMDFYTANFSTENWEHSGSGKLGTSGIWNSYLYQHYLSVQAGSTKSYKRTCKIFHKLSSTKSGG